MIVQQRVRDDGDILALRARPGNFSGDFSLQMTVALRDQLIAAFSELRPVPLDLANLGKLERRGGVYILYMDDDLAYVGKADKDLKGRLERHATRFAARLGGILNRVSFKCVYMDDDLHAVSAEKMLIAYHLASGEAKLNFKGFGSNDPGKERDTSAVESNHFDARFPIDLLQWIELDFSRDQSLHDVMTHLKKALPYLFRFSGPKTVDAQSLRQVSVPKVGQGHVGKSARDWFEWVARQMPAGWIIVALPGYVIAYPGRDPKKYKARTEYWRS